MIEVELKGYANDDIFDHVREKFKLMRREYQEDTYFSHPCRDFSETDEALRIRVKKFNGHFEAFLTYKGPKLDQESKTRREIEVPITDPDEHEQILNSLGFHEVMTVVKVREKYYYDKGIVITLDNVEGLGKFVEVETLVESEEEIEPAVKRLRGILNSIGVTKLERRSYLELLLGGKG
ncbi:MULTISPECIES: class IV adenylate cyclase [Thermococcus]|jgi:adenylate cyclase class 2|uniref:Adenylate cyclase n=2 Tax=Thermococcus TaxID=2263 RepID=A0A100XX66_9EURY|nr:MULTISPECIES: class IV adenylate cyclase [Thermococcus]KUH32796.1 adenylate cyclase [Thermococcus celericrescens]NJE01862.1 class IV adenylate cyclase [Thermococcus sp. JdF3]QEK14462.1 class IV adenylate cyclase [Thermococcus aciditolerans]